MSVIIFIFCILRCVTYEHKLLFLLYNGHTHWQNRLWMSLYLTWWLTIIWNTTFSSYVCNYIYFLYFMVRDVWNKLLFLLYIVHTHWQNRLLWMCLYLTWWLTIIRHMTFFRHMSEIKIITCSIFKCYISSYNCYGNSKSQEWIPNPRSGFRIPGVDSESKVRGH